MPIGLTYVLIKYLQDEKKLSIYGCTGSIGDSTFKLFKKIIKNTNFIYLTGFKNYKKIKYLIKKYKPTFFVIFDNQTFFKVKKENRKKM